MASAESVCSLSVQRAVGPVSMQRFASSLVSGLTKSISSRVSPEYFFRVYTRTREIFRRVPNTHTREWDVARYSQHRITKGIREYYSYSQFWRI